MRTRHLLTAIALPALFAACTNEDFVKQTASGSTSLDDRRMVDVPTVTVGLGEDAETRLALNGNKFVFESTDKLGACLMDEITNNYQNPQKKWGEWFELVDYIQTNYKFNYNPANGNFENNALMCEGNYFFYFPYDPTMNTREAFEQDLAAEQELKVNADGTLNPRQTVLDNQIFLGHSAIYGDREDHESLNVNMKGVFAYPAFRIAYSSPKPITITKVAFKIVDNKTDKTKEGTVTPFETTLKVNPEKASFDADNQYVLAKDAVFYGMVSAADGGTTAEQISVSMPDNAACTLSSGETLAGYVVIPAGVYDATKDDANKSLWMYVYTNEGVVKTYLNQKNEEQEASGAPSDNVWTEAAYTNFQPDNGMLIDMGFSYEAISAPTEFRVSETEDFETMLGWQAGQTTPTTVTATVVGKDIVLTKKIIDILNNNKNLTLNLTSDADATVAIAADAPANALDRVNIADKINVINNAKLTLAEDIKKVVGSDTYTPKSLINNADASLTLTAGSYDFTGCTVTNYGTITFAEANAESASFTNGSIDKNRFANYGTVEFKTSTTIGHYSRIDNYHSLTIDEKIEVSGRIYNSIGYIKSTNTTTTGLIWVKGKWSNAYSQNNASIWVNEGGEIVGMSFQNMKDSDEPYKAGVNESGNWLVDNQGNVIYYSSIINYGVVRNVINNNLVEMKSKTARLITAATSDGEIDNTECSNYVTKQAKETIFCVVNKPITATALKDLAINSNAKRLDISGEITINPVGEATDVTVEIEEVDIEGNLTISGAGKTLRFTNGTTGTEVNVVNGTTTVASQAILSLGAANECDGKLNVGGNTTFIISNGALVYGNKGTIDGTVENYGTWFYKAAGGGWTAYTSAELQ